MPSMALRVADRALPDTVDSQAGPADLVEVRAQFIRDLREAGNFRGPQGPGLTADSQGPASPDLLLEILHLPDPVFPGPVLPDPVLAGPVLNVPCQPLIPAFEIPTAVVRSDSTDRLTAQIMAPMRGSGMAITVADRDGTRGPMAMAIRDGAIRIRL
jgi:hypothetical protein